MSIERTPLGRNESPSRHLESKMRLHMFPASPGAPVDAASYSPEVDEVEGDDLLDAYELQYEDDMNDDEDGEEPWFSYDPQNYDGGIG